MIAILMPWSSRDGDLTSNRIDELSVMHRIPVPPPDLMSSVGDDLTFPLTKSLSLEVGELGVIGRRISFVHDRKLLGQGVIGWN